MAATYECLIGGVAKTLRRGWSHQAAANGRDTFTGVVRARNGSYRPALNAAVVLSEAVAIATSSNANPTHVITAEAHGIVSGQTVTVAGHSVSGVNGANIATRVSATEFTLPVASTGGTGGTVARRLFGGAIEAPVEQGAGGYGLATITTELPCADYNAQAERRVINEVLAGGTLLAMLTRIGVILTITIHPNQVTGPTLAALPCEYATLRDVLDTVATTTGYAWEFDAFNRLRMFLPNTEAAPVNVIDGNDVAVGDISVTRSRTNYANRVILRYSNAATAAWGYLITNAGANFSNNDTVTVGGVTYTFKSSLTNVAGYVQLGATGDESLVHLACAICLTGTPGSDYAAVTTINPSVTAWTYGSPQSMAVRALVAGASGNSLVGTTATTAMWIWEGGIWGGTPITQLNGGADQALTNVSIATDASWASDPWDLVVESPETTSQAAADVLSAAVLAVRLVETTTVRYETYALGLRPGQTQTITIANRNVNGTYLITEVASQNTNKARVLRTVTAISSLLAQSADRWQDAAMYGGAVSGGAVSVSGGGSTGWGAGGLSQIGFGGSSVEAWPAPAASAYVAANSVQVRVDTAVRGSAVGTCYVRVRASAGSVTARLRDLTNGATAGTSAAVSSTTWQTVSFPIALTTGAAVYEIELSGSVEGADLGLGSAYLE
jgi:hypothetical protein